MKRKGPQRYSTEIIQSAIAKYEGGAKLSAIARELSIEKSTVKYWLDNASKFLPEAGSNPAVARIGQRATRESWDIIFAALKEIKRKLDEGTLRDLILVISELFDIQARIGALTGRHAMPEKSLEKSEEVRITVQRYLQKKITEEAESEKTSLSGEPVQSTEGTPARARPAEIVGQEREANGASG